jgi:NAD(P)-dependent dehydrogenase (short-subunit alcohol dehydrogenase family)
LDAIKAQGYKNAVNGQKGAEKMRKDFEGKVALVTGAGSGIGRAAVISFARLGARVVGVDRDKSKGEETFRIVQVMGGVGAFAGADVTQGMEIKAAVQRAADLFGRLDYAVNCAGITTPVEELAEASEETWDRIMSVNAKGIWLSMKYEIQALLSGGGAIVNISSALGLVGSAGMAIYAASKHAIVGLTRCAALDYAVRGIRVNAIAPGAVDTPMVNVFIAATGGDPSKMNAIRAAHPMGRIARPEEIANAAVWLCSSQSSFITGHVLSVDGGYVAL